jgi:hypothetical protein
MLSKICVWDPGSEIWGPGSGKNLFRIPDPGVKKAPDPGSATLLSARTVRPSNVLEWWRDEGSRQPLRGVPTLSKLWSKMFIQIGIFSIPDPRVKLVLDPESTTLVGRIIVS